MSDNMTVRTFAALHDRDERTVQRWLRAGKLPGAVKTNKGWVIPADAKAPEPDGVVAPSSGTVLAVPGVPAAPALPQGVGLSAVVEALPVAFIPLEAAVMLLGIQRGYILSNRDEFGVRPWGPHNSLVMPVATVRRFAGL